MNTSAKWNLYEPDSDYNITGRVDPYDWCRVRLRALAVAAGWRLRALLAAVIILQWIHELRSDGNASRAVLMLSTRD